MNKKLLILCTIALLPAYMVYSQNTDFFDSGKNHTEDVGMQSDFHKNNVGKIVFSKKRIDPKTDGKDLISSFKIGDFIYAEMFLQTCPLNYKVYGGKLPVGRKNEYGQVEVLIYIDGKKQDYQLFQQAVKGEMSGRTYLGLPIIGEGEDVGYTSDNFVSSLNKLENGKHTIKLELMGHCQIYTAYGGEVEFATKTPIASGEFTIEKTADSQAKTGRNWNSVEAKMTDADIETRALKALKEYATAQGWKESFIKIKIVMEDWAIEYNKNSGVIMSRRIDCIAYATWPDGHCTYQRFAFAQDYDGSGYQKKIYCEGVISGTQEKIDCDK